MPRYRAFISYSHRDRAWGDWLHRGLERYRMPTRLVGTPGRDGPVPARLYPVFRDREELPGSADLGHQIQDALEQSAILVVICSPNAAVSRWVGEEILTFRRLGRDDRILSVITDGIPNASDGPGAGRECFPAALTHHLGALGQADGERIEPLAADARPEGDGRHTALLKLIAGIVGVPFESLRRRELEAARRRARIAQGIAASMVLLALVALGAGAIALDQSVSAMARLGEAQTAQSLALLQRVQDEPPYVAVPALLAALPRDVENQTDRPLVPAVAAQLALSLNNWTELGRVVVQPSEQTGGLQVAGASPVMVAFTDQFPSTVATFRLRDGSRMQEWRSATDRTTDATITDDGAWIAVARVGRPSHLMLHANDDTGRTRELWQPEPATARRSIDAAVPAQDGAVVIGFDNVAGSIELAALDPGSGAVLDVQQAAPGGSAKSIWFDPSGRFALAFTADNGVVAWQLGRRLRCVGALEGVHVESEQYAEPKPFVSLNADGSVIAIDAAREGAVSFHAMTDGHRLGGFSLANPRLRHFAFAGTDLLTVDSTGTWTSGSASGQTHQFQWPFDRSKGETFNDATWADSGATMLVVLSSDVIETWDWRHDRRIARSEAVAGQARLSAAGFSWDGTAVLLGRRDGTLERRSLANLSVTANWAAGSQVRSVGRESKDGTAMVRLADGQICTLNTGQPAPPSCRQAADRDSAYALGGDGDQLVLRRDRGELLVTDADGHARRTLTRPRDLPMGHLRFDHAGRSLASSTWGQPFGASVFDVASGVLRWQSAALQSSVKALAFDPTDRFLAVLTEDGLQIFDLTRSGDPVWRLADTGLTSVVFTQGALLLGHERGGTDAFASDGDGGWKPLPTRSLSREQGSVVATDRSGETLVARRSPDGAYVVFSSTSGVIHSTFPSEISFNGSAALSSDGTIAVLFDVQPADGSIKLLLAKPEKQLEAISLSQPGPVVVAAFLPGGRLATSTADGQIAVTTAVSGSPPVVGKCRCGEVTGVFAASAGERLLVVGMESAVMFSTEGLQELGRLKLEADTARWPRADAELKWLALDIPPGGTVFALAEKLDRSLPHKFGADGLGFAINSLLQLSASGKRIVSIYDRTAFWLAPGDLQRAAQHHIFEAPPLSAALDRSGRVLAVWLGNNHLLAIDLALQSVLFDLPDIGQVTDLGFAGPGDRLILLRQFDGITRVFNVADGNDRGFLSTPAGRPVRLDAVTSAGGPLIAGLLQKVDGSDRGTMMFWRADTLVATGATDVTRPGHQLPIFVTPGSGPRLIASADGRWAFAFRDGGTAALVPVVMPEWQAVIDRACGRIARPLSASERASYFLTETPGSPLSLWWAEVIRSVSDFVAKPRPMRPCGRGLTELKP